jgi:5-methylcytosine-specific restriction endonuclease McrA
MFGSRELFNKGQRKCYICKEIFLLNNSNFTRNRSKKHGYASQCKKCKYRIQGFPDSIIKIKLIEESNFTCRGCKVKNITPGFFDIDHIIPVRLSSLKRGFHFLKNSSKENLQVLCPNCHRLKTITDRKNK